MKRNLRLLFLIILGLLCISEISPQDSWVYEQDTNKSDETTSLVPENVDSNMKFGRNYIIVNVGLIELINVNYERNIIHRPTAWTNIRIGFGEVNDLQGGGNEYIVALTQLYGRRNSHAEFNLGLIYIRNHKENLNPSASSFNPYYYAGYRFEKPHGHFIFRTGLFLPSIFALSLGIGIKF